MRLRKPQVLFRQLHRWGAVLIALPLLVMIGAGLLLMLKKEVAWIQPPTARGSEAAVPRQSFDALFEAAKAVPEAGISDLADLERVDLKPDRGIVKFVARSRWEVQVDTASAEVLHVAVRRSDLIEQLHDGSFFGEWVKLYIFLPAASVLFLLWLTGLYLFILPHWKRAERRHRRRATFRGEGNQ